VFSIYDTNNDGKLSLGEFCEYWKNREETPDDDCDDEETTQVFNAFDTNNDGKISVQEF